MFSDLMGFCISNFKSEEKREARKRTAAYTRYKVITGTNLKASQSRSLITAFLHVSLVMKVEKNGNFLKHYIWVFAFGEVESFRNQ